MELNGSDPTLAAQRRYATWLAWGTRLGLALLVLGFAAYVTGLVAPHVAIERLPVLWQRAASELLQETGVRAGWGWAALVHRSDMIVLGGIALLASCSIPALAASVAAFSRRRETIFVAICILQVGVLVLAASGVLARTH